MSVYKQDGYNEKTHLTILNKVNELAKRNNDGFSVVALNYKNPQKKVIRLLKYDEKVFSQILKKFDVVNLHLRLSTSGSEEEHNLHFWKGNEWYFAHNGMLTSLSHDKKFSDSYLFFRKAVEANAFGNPKYLKFKKIEKLAEDNNFWGRICIVNPSAKKIFYLGDWHNYLIKNEAMIVGSCDLEFNKVKRFLGFDFLEEIAYPEVEFEGVNMIALNTGTTYQLAKDFCDSYSSYPTYSTYNGYNYGTRTLIDDKYDIKNHITGFSLD